MAVSCQNCGYFKPFHDGSYSRQNGGNCGQYEHYRDVKGFTESQLNRLMVELGGVATHHVFSGGSERDCKKFKDLKND